MSIELPSQVLELQGPEAVAFAQAQFSSDLRTLSVGRWQWSAWLSAQGRVRHWFALLRPSEDRLLLWLRGGEAAAMRDQLARFVFRSKVRLRDAGELRVHGMSAAETAAALGTAPAGAELVQRGDSFALRLTDGRCVALGTDASAADASTQAREQWRLADIRAGFPELAPVLQGELLPQWLGLDRLGAISVNKGCYPGQEIMARLHFKGGNKRALHRLTWRAVELPQPGTPLLASDAAEAGTIVQSEWATPPQAEALAVLTNGSSPTHLAGGGAAEFEVVSRFD